MTDGLGGYKALCVQTTYVFPFTAGMGVTGGCVAWAVWEHWTMA